MLASYKQKASAISRSRLWSWAAMLLCAFLFILQMQIASAQIVNTVTAIGNANGTLVSATDNETVSIAPIVSNIEFKKTVVSIVQKFPEIFEITYQLSIQNIGTVTQTNISISDDLITALTPATINNMPTTSMSGFSGSGAIDASYNGHDNITVLSGDNSLAPGQVGIVNISVQINTSGESISGSNTAYYLSDQISTPMPSDDPSVTITIPTDTNSTPSRLVDFDEDGAPDGFEGSGDRDGDWIVDSADYDPTGYFYCQADGRILTGGQVSVRNLSTGALQIGVGTSNNINIVEDGSTGFYQFNVTQPGSYELLYLLPTSGVASTNRTSLGTLDLTSLLPDNPAVIGATEVGSTGVLADSSASNNPFYTIFDIEAGDPSIFANNIPLQSCGTSQLSAQKQIVSTQGSTVRYRLSVSSTGNEPVNNVQLSDDLNTAFGAGQYTVQSLQIENAPSGFSASVNTAYNGDSNIALLTNGGTLAPNESVSLLLDITVQAGTFTNEVIASGTTPLNGGNIPNVTAQSEVTISNEQTILVEKVASTNSAILGAPLSYLIIVSNTSNNIVSDLKVVDVTPNGMSYIIGSAKLDGVASEPIVSTKLAARELVWPNISIAANSSVTFKVGMTINASATASNFVNSALVRDVYGNVLSNVAKAKVELGIEPVLQCSDLIGRVFDDKDQDGYFDKGEVGLKGVRLVSVTGLIIESDKFGRFHIACGAIPDAQIGSNFILKLDTKSLPRGYRLTSENPRIVRLSRGKLAKINFAAAKLRVVDFELNSNSFTHDDRLNASVIGELGEVLNVLEEEHSVLSINYSLDGTSKKLAKIRLAGVKRLVKSAWNARKRRFDLNIDMNLIDK